MFKKLFAYMRVYKLECVLGPLFKLIEACFELIVPLVVAQIIDNGIGKGNTAYIWNRGLILLILGILGLVFSITAQYFAAKSAVGVSGHIRKTLYTKATQLSAAQLDSIGSATLLQRLTGDMDKIQNGLNLALRLMLRSPFVVVGATIMAFTVDTQSAMVFVCVVPLLALVVFGIMRCSIPLFAAHQSASDKVTLSVKENLEGVRVIRAFGREDSEIARFKKLVGAFTETGVAAARISALTNPLTSVLINAALIALIYKGAVSVNTGLITQGALVALVNYMSQILVELIKFASLVVSVTKALASFERVQKIIDLPENKVQNTANESSADSDVAVCFNNVSFAYPSAGGDALSGIDFSAGIGETIGIVGPTGSGKSTLSMLIQGIYSCTSGKISLFGKDVVNYGKSELCSLVSVVSQNPRLFSGTLADNVRFGNHNASDDEIIRALDIAQATDIVKKKSRGIESEAGQSGRNLSGGQKQRIALARAFIKESRILILDDSASALDMKTDAALRQAIAREFKDKTVFIISQRASSVRNADMILVMDDGRITARGKHDELMNTSALYREIYLSQFPEGEAYAQ